MRLSDLIGLCIIVVLAACVSLKPSQAGDEAKTSVYPNAFREVSQVAKDAIGEAGLSINRIEQVNASHVVVHCRSTWTDAEVTVRISGVDPRLTLVSVEVTKGRYFTGGVLKGIQRRLPAGTPGIQLVGK